MRKVNHNTECKYYSGVSKCLKNNNCSNCDKVETYSHHFLIVILDRLGDVLMTTSLVESLKEMYPNCRVTWLTAHNAIGILANNPKIDRVMDDRWENIYQLNSECFDWVINFERFSFAPTLVKDIKAERKTGFMLDERGNVVWADEKSSIIFDINRYPDFRSANTLSWEEMYHHMCGLALKDNNRTKIYLDNKNEENANRIKDDILKSSELILGICIGSHYLEKQKRWSLENIKEFCKQIRGYTEKRVKIMIIAGPYELDAVKYLKEHLDKEVYFACADTVLELASYVYILDLVVTNDSFTLHIANAFDKDTVAIFGPDNPHQVRNYKNLIKIRQAECLPCHQRICKFSPDDKELKCMKNVEADKILSVVKDLIKERYKGN